MAIAILLRRCSRPTGIPDSIVSLSNTKKILFFRQTHKLLSFSSRSSAKCSSSVFFASHVPYSNNAVNDGEIYSDVEKDDAVAIYIHWPFCRQLCSYCNFNKYVRSIDGDFERRMAECILQDAMRQFSASGASSIYSIYFGGGTPSLCSPSTIDTIISGLCKMASLVAGAEVTLEANPSSSTDDKLRQFKAAGVNRLSLGVQSLRDDDLKLLCRDHTRKDSLRTINWCRSIFGEDMSLDVIFARPGQTLSDWRSEVTEVLTLCGNHLSLYELTVEAGTPLAKQVERGELSVPNADLKSDMYQLAIEMLQSQGLIRYQVSNFAKKGFQAKHNSSYWYGREYIGLGPGAHGRYRRYRGACEWGSASATATTSSDRHWCHCVQVPEPKMWMNQVKSSGNGLAKCKELSKLDLFQQVLISGLYTDQGLDHSTWQRLCPEHHLCDIFANAVSKGSSFGDHVILDQRGLRLSTAGVAIADSLLPHLMLRLEEYLDQQ